VWTAVHSYTQAPLLNYRARSQALEPRRFHGGTLVGFFALLN
jgi:hypothetical protein